MKKIISMLLVVAMILSSVCGPLTAKAEEASRTDTVTAEKSGIDDVPFSNEYNGYCIDFHKSPTLKDETFSYMQSTVGVDNNITGEDVSQQIKFKFI